MADFLRSTAVQSSSVEGSPVRDVQSSVRRIVRIRVDSWLLLATVVGLFGCPLLLDDRFSLATLSGPDAGACIGDGCVPAPNATGGSSGAQGGTGNETAGFAGAMSAAGSGTSAGTTSGGTGGTSNAVDAGGNSSASEPCWTLELTQQSYDPQSNCVGVHGSTTLTTDATTSTTLSVSYDNGDVCFTGTVATSGWGAVYEVTFAGDDDGNSVWNASETHVTGFEFAQRGSEQPDSLRVIYKDPSGVDNCDVIGPGTSSVPFSAAHPGCNDSGNTVDTTRLVEMILAFVPRSQPYDLDFCVQIRALD
jgi:hypothetical protein